MKSSTLLTTILLLICVPAAYGQFTITAPITVDEVELADSVSIDPSSATVKNTFFSYGKWMADQRAMRKERNTIEFNSGLNISQTGFENWAAGGDNTFTGTATLYFRHQYQKEKLGMDYKLEGRYGFNRIEKKNFKNEDEFQFNYLITWNIKNRWSYAASVNFRSQFATGYESRDDKTRKSTFMAPGFLDISVGFTYTNEPFTIVLSPVGGSATFVLDDELSERGIHGLDPGQRSKWKVGPSVRANYDKQFYKDIFRFRSELYTFTNFKTAPLARWENTFSIKATRFLTTSIYALMYYDKESETPKPDQLQFKYSLALGLTYTFKNK